MRARAEFDNCKASSSHNLKMILIVLIFASLLHDALSYGHDGHALTGSLAEAHLKAHAATTWWKVQEIIPEILGLDREATWADDIRNQPWYQHWRDSLHYQDATTDDEPKTCFVNTKIDCPSGNCLIPAIMNYSQRLGDETLGQEDRKEALRMFIHLVGDLSQPLHLSGIEKGGTGTKVHFDKAYATLHAVWDRKLIEKRIKDSFNYSIEKYKTYLIDEMEKLPIQPDCPVCPELWAQDISQLNCRVVWNNLTGDLGGDYYEAAWPEQERQIILTSLRISLALQHILGPHSRAFKLIVQ